jgi:hypothetical protein
MTKRMYYFVVTAYRNGKKFTYRVKSRSFYTIPVQEYVEKKYNVQVKEIVQIPNKPDRI